MAKLEITLCRGLQGRTPKQNATATALGLSKKWQTVKHDDTPSVRGMIEKLHHMVTVREVKE